jgi:hypothetical protein
MAAREVHQGIYALLRKQSSAGVRERRDGVQQFGPRARGEVAQHALQRIHSQPLCIHRHLVDRGARKPQAASRKPQGLGRRRVRERLEQHGIAWLDQHTNQQVESLLRTGRHQEFLLVSLDHASGT